LISQPLEFIAHARPVAGAHLGEFDHPRNRRRCQPGAFGEIAGFVFAPGPKQKPHRVRTETIEFVDRAQNLPALAVADDADGFEHAVQNFAVVHLHHIAAAEPEPFERVAQHHVAFGVR